MNASFKVKLTTEIQAFIENRKQDLKFYTASRGQAKDEDLYVGVYAELAAYQYLKNAGYNVNEPDFTMHKKKSFSADLTDGETRFHIKGQSKSSSDKYGHSWLFQRSDKLFTNATATDIVIGCSVDVAAKTVQIMFVKSFHNIVFGECKLVWFQKTKRAIYLEDQL